MLPAVYIFLFIFGAMVGSFLNVLIYRLPKGIDFVRGRSFCPHCRRTLRWHELIPLVSFLSQRGKCLQCLKPISWSYFAVELSSGFLFVLAYLFFWPAGVGAWLFSTFLLEIFLVLLATDLKYFLLPDKLVFTGVGVTVLYGLMERTGLVPNSFQILSLSNLLAAGLLFLVFFCLWFFSKGKWMGFGDAKLAILVGLAFGFWGGLTVIYLAVVLGAIVALILLAFSRANLKTKLPLGFFIGLAAIVHIFSNRDIMELSEYAVRFLSWVF